MSGSDEEPEPVTDLSDSNVVTKYKEAAGIANRSLTGLISFCKPDTKVSVACSFGDTLITKQCEGVFKSKKIEKGIAFPTCISVNEIVCHYSPLESDPGAITLKAGDVIRADLGVHIDGYIAVAAHTFICKAPDAEADPVMEGKNADCFIAAYTALEGCVKLVKEGAKNSSVTEFIKKVADQYKVTPVQGVLMHQLKRFVIDGNEVIINREEPDQKVDEFSFEKNRVYSLDIVLSTGSGNPIQKTHRTTVFKRAIDQNYNLKMRASRALFKKVQNDCGTLPFTLRGLLDDDRQAKLGTVELISHGLVHEYPVLEEKDLEGGEKACVVHLKATVLVMGNGTVRVTSMQTLEEAKKQYKSEIEPTDEIKEVLSRSSKNKKKKKKKPAAAQS